MARRRGRPSKGRKVAHDWEAWGYPRTDDNDGPIDWAWSCRCGRHGHGYKDEAAARQAAEDHLPTETT